MLEGLKSWLMQSSRRIPVSTEIHPVGAEWRNWSGYVRGRSQAFAQPASEEELSGLVRQARRVRVVGAGHSFTPLVPTDGLLVSLDKLSGLLNHDAGKLTATVWGGTRLYQLGPILEAIGQALPNMGDVDRQSIAGAVSTGTHGSGLGLGSLSAGVAGLRLVLADGSGLECSPTQNPEVFKAARVSLGALGVISQVTLQNMPRYRLKEEVRVVGLGKLLPELPKLAQENRHLDCHVFPFSGQVIVKGINPTDEPAGQTEVNEFVENTVLEWACQVSRAVPALNAPIQKLVGFFVGSSQRVGESYKIFATPRAVRFNEMEYHVPAERGPECLAEVCAAIRRSGVQVFIPVEFRYVAGDDIWLSPFQGGRRASIAVHQYFKQDPWPLFRHLEPIFWRYGGRPHWGKMHSLKAPQLRELYPHWDDFQRVRGELDPGGKFLNSYLREVFGL